MLMRTGPFPDFATGHHPAALALRAYLAAVTGELGIGLESCTVDHATPLSAYVALDGHPHYPGRDLALLWDEERGWAAAVETHSGEDLIILRYLDSPAVAPSPRSVARFARAVLEDDHACGRPDPVTIRTAGTPEALAELLRRELP